MYTQSITRSHRTAFFLAIDCSGSMAEPIHFRGGCKAKSEVVATIANELLFELIERARRSDGVRDYYDIAVLGYHGDDEEHYANRYASLLYDCSSTMPEPFHAAIRELKGAGALPPFRGLCFNASAAELVSALNIGSISVKTE